MIGKKYNPSRPPLKLRGGERYYPLIIKSQKKDVSISS